MANARAIHTLASKRNAESLKVLGTAARNLDTIEIRDELSTLVGDDNRQYDQLTGPTLEGWLLRSVGRDGQKRRGGQDGSQEGKEQGQEGKRSPKASHPSAVLSHPVPLPAPPAFPALSA